MLCSLYSKKQIDNLRKIHLLIAKAADQNIFNTNSNINYIFFYNHGSTYFGSKANPSWSLHTVRVSLREDFKQNVFLIYRYSEY